MFPYFQSSIFSLSVLFFTPYRFPYDLQREGSAVRPAGFREAVRRGGGGGFDK